MKHVHFKIQTFTATIKTSGGQINKRQSNYASPFILFISSKMNTIIKCLILFLLNYATRVQCETYSVKIGTETYANVVDSRFLSFTVDPMYLFANSEKYNR